MADQPHIHTTPHANDIKELEARMRYAHARGSQESRKARGARVAIQKGEGRTGDGRLQVTPPPRPMDPQQLVLCAHPPARLGRSHLSVEMISSSLLICLRK